MTSPQDVRHALVEVLDRLPRRSVPVVVYDDVYRRPCEGTDNARAAMQAYLDWEHGLVDQLERDATHGLIVI